MYKQFMNNKMQKSLFEGFHRTKFYIESSFYAKMTQPTKINQTAILTQNSLKFLTTLYTYQTAHVLILSIPLVLNLSNRNFEINREYKM